MQENDVGVNVDYKEWLKEMYRKRGEREKILLDLLHKDNAKIESEIKSRGEIPNWYSCQKCGLDFCSEKEFIIIVGEEPICKICLGEIKGEGENEKLH